MYPLPGGVMLNLVLQMENPAADRAQNVFGLQKNFDDCHV